MSAETEQNNRTPPLDVLRIRNFRLLWMGAGISVLGDQFYLIALPWLVLQLTNGDAFATGAVLAVAGVPRALFMLIGGAFTDRFSPRTILLYSDIIRLGLTAVLAVLVLSQVIELWMLYIFAIVFGIADAFSFPAANAILPAIVEKNLLQTANAFIQGTVQFSVFAGPMLAGVIIASMDSNSAAVENAAENVPGMTGIGVAFAFDSVTFLVSTIMLWQIRIRKRKEKAEAEGSESGMLASILEGLVSVWADKMMRMILFISLAINLFFNGPLIVGIPFLADTRFAEGAAAFGIIMSGMGGGSLLGIVLAGTLPKPPGQYLGALLMLLLSVLGVGLILFAFIHSTLVATIVTFVMGISNGYAGIFYITWLQSRTPPEMLGAGDGIDYVRIVRRSAGF